MKAETKHIFGKISLFVAIAGIVLPLFVFMWLIETLPRNYTEIALMKSSIVFFLMQVLAAVVGILGWKSKFGKWGVLVSVVSLVIGVLCWCYAIVSVMYFFNF